MHWPTSLRSASVAVAIGLIFGTSLPCKAELVFNPASDSFSFANETVFEHANRPVGESLGNDGGKYSRRCFAMVRGALYFFQNARFDPLSAPPKDEAAVRLLIQKITSRPLWLGPLPENERIVVGGYPNLKKFSKAHAATLQRELGEGLPTYFRPANMRVAFPVAPALQSVAAKQIMERLDRGHAPAVMITRFDKLNHALVVTGYTHEMKGQIVFSIYDPNLPDEALTLNFDPNLQAFSFGKTFYWPGGPVRVLRIYHSPLH